MRQRGECLACSKLGECGETSLDRVLASYTCAMFREAPEPVYQARWQTMKQFGERNAVSAMLQLQPTNPEDETDG